MWSVTVPYRNPVIPSVLVHQITARRDESEDLTANMAFLRRTPAADMKRECMMHIFHGGGNEGLVCSATVS